jgi:hypothetical protein
MGVKDMFVLKECRFPNAITSFPPDSFTAALTGPPELWKCDAFLARTSFSIVGLACEAERTL